MDASTPTALVHPSSLDTSTMLNQLKHNRNPDKLTRTKNHMEAPSSVAEYLYKGRTYQGRKGQLLYKAWSTGLNGDVEAYRMNMDGVIAVLVLASKPSSRAGQRP